MMMMVILIIIIINKPTNIFIILFDIINDIIIKYQYK